MKVGDLVMRRIWVNEGILVGASKGKWVGTGDIGVIVSFWPMGTPKVLMSNGEVHRFIKESLQVLSPAIKATPMGGAPPESLANSAQNFS